MILLTGCASDGVTPVYRTLPPPADVVLPPAPKVTFKPGDDARVAWKREEARADANATRLVKSRKIYSGVVTTFDPAANTK